MGQEKRRMEEQVRLSNLRAGQIYEIEEIATNETDYFGLTEQSGTLRDPPFVVRFAQHAISAINIFKTADLWHVYMAGKVAEYVVKNRTSRVSTEVVGRIFRPKLVHDGMFAPGELRDLET